ncbi:hypothetical protein Ddye_020464 [Dipteronia dyeriana]|uniref:Uncharacterized protein n=1 Tax=Dipteronia dyeriana TaxID=168575 RepID=A0AAD9WVE1_9ROSI|nr:hypothetical protein Ddye_020464 [Dipteronia dyeriana]
MWFWFGKLKARFGQEEFCLCNGLKMGQLPEGFANNNEVPKDSMLSKIFKRKRPTAEVLYATLSKMTSEQSQDAYKKLSIYMVWAMERIIRVDNNIGKRIGMGYPQFSIWKFTARILDIESKLNASVCT